MKLPAWGAALILARNCWAFKMVKSDKTYHERGVFWGSRSVRRHLRCFVVELPRELPCWHFVVSSLPLRFCWDRHLCWRIDFSWLTVLSEPLSWSPPKHREEVATLLAHGVIKLWHIHWAVWAAEINAAEYIIDSLVSYLSQPAYFHFRPLKTL